MAQDGGEKAKELYKNGKEKQLFDCRPILALRPLTRCLQSNLKCVFCIGQTHKQTDIAISFDAILQFFQYFKNILRFFYYFITDSKYL